MVEERDKTIYLQPASSPFCLFPDSEVQNPDVDHSYLQRTHSVPKTSHIILVRPAEPIAM